MPNPVFEFAALANAFDPDGELWAWGGAYDNFLGHMVGVLPLLTAGQKGFEIL